MLLAQLMDFLKPFTTRQNLTTRLNREWERATEQFAAAEAELRAAAAGGAASTNLAIVVTCSCIQLFLTGWIVKQCSRATEQFAVAVVELGVIAVAGRGPDEATPAGRPKPFAPSPSLLDCAQFPVTCCAKLVAPGVGYAHYA